MDKPEPIICECGKPVAAEPSGGAYMSYAMPVYPHFDDDGRRHVHNPNRGDGFRGEFICQAGHKFTRYGPSCWCGWPTEPSSVMESA